MVDNAGVGPDDVKCFRFHSVRNLGFYSKYDGKLY